MKGAEFRTQLSDYYRKEVALFLKHLKRARESQDEKAIHKLRVDIKRLRAVFEFFEILFPKQFHSRPHNSILKPVFHSGGKIRDRQVNLLRLSQYHLPDSLVDRYRQFCEKPEKRQQKKFIRAVRKTDVDLLKKSGRDLEKRCLYLSHQKIREVSQKFLREESRSIARELSMGNRVAHIHQVRMHLKSLNAVVSLLNKITESRDLKTVSVILRKEGMLIGRWHDKMALASSLKEFLLHLEKRHVKIKRSLLTLNLRLKKEEKQFFSPLRTRLQPLLKKIQALEM